MLKESEVEGVAPGSPEGARRATGDEPAAAAIVGRRAASADFPKENLHA